MVLEKNVRNLENLDDEGIKGLKLDNISET